MSEVPPVLRARGIRRSYRSGLEEIRVLDGLDLDLAPGELVAVIGSSGVGKSTLLHLLGLLDRPDEGTIELHGKPASGPRRGGSGAPGGAALDAVRNASIGFVFQFFHLVPELTAEDNVLLPARIRCGFLEWMREGADHRERARGLLREFGLADRMTHRPSQLSGGERQRVAIARALVNGPAVVLCDEPTGNLDPTTSRGVWDLLKGVRSRGAAILVVTHNEALAAEADRVLHLVAGRLEPYALRRTAVGSTP
jgi:lipoprotein-releasing system ATP-binding protein